MSTQTETASIDNQTLLKSLNIKTENKELAPLNLSGQVKNNNKNDEAARLLSSLSICLANIDTYEGYNKVIIQNLIEQIDTVIDAQVNEILHDETFKSIESTWLSINELVEDTNFKANIVIDLLDITKEEIAEDLEMNSIDITGSEMYRKIYLAEYDQFGGLPYGSVIGLYDFTYNDEDMSFLSTMGKVCAVSHSPFVASVSPTFFGVENLDELSKIRDLEGLMSHPKYTRWEKFRKSEQATYVGLTLPRYLVRVPYGPETNPARSSLASFKEAIEPTDENQYVWGSSAMLFAKNLTRAFAQTGWCQKIRGVQSGGYITDMAQYEFEARGKKEIKTPVEMAIPDYLEYAFSNSGFIPLVAEKNSNSACFFATPSIKKAEEFVDGNDTKNSAMIANLAYTYSVSRIAHYLKIMNRELIGEAVDAPYLQGEFQAWINKYVNTATIPSAVSLKFYPFKAAEIKVTPSQKMLGFFDCSFTILPHIQMEGINTVLALDTRLDGADAGGEDEEEANSGGES